MGYTLSLLVCRIQYITTTIICLLQFAKWLTKNVGILRNSYTAFYFHWLWNNKLNCQTELNILHLKNQFAFCLSAWMKQICLFCPLPTNVLVHLEPGTQPVLYTHLHPRRQFDICHFGPLLHDLCCCTALRDLYCSSNDNFLTCFPLVWSLVSGLCWWTLSSLPAKCNSQCHPTAQNIITKILIKCLFPLNF